MNIQNQSKNMVGDLVDDHALRSVACINSKDSIVNALKFGICGSALIYLNLAIQGHHSDMMLAKFLFFSMLALVLACSVFFGLFIGNYIFNEKITVPRLKSAIINSDVQVVEVEARSFFSGFLNMPRSAKRRDQSKIRVNCFLKTNESFHAYGIEIKSAFGSRVYYAIPCSYFPKDLDAAIFKRAN